jgi:hypothetical protein
MMKNLATAFVCALMLSTSGAFAMGHGGGTGGGGGGGASGGGNGLTKIQFNLKVGDLTSGRFFGKFDVSGAVTSNGTSFFAIPGNTMHGKSRNFELAGYNVALTIGSASFTGTADDKGKVTTPFSAKLTGNGNICQVKASGLDLQDLLPINTADGSHTVTVAINLTATKTVTTNGVSTTYVATLSNQNVTFNYTVKHGNAKGKNF